MREFTLAFVRVGTITIEARSIDEAFDIAYTMQRNGVDDEEAIDWSHELTFEGIV